jgi:hypothetical protein
MVKTKTQEKKYMQTSNYNYISTKQLKQEDRSKHVLLILTSLSATLVCSEGLVSFRNNF